MGYSITALHVAGSRRHEVLRKLDGLAAELDQHLEKQVEVVRWDPEVMNKRQRLFRLVRCGPRRWHIKFRTRLAVLGSGRWGFFGSKFCRRVVLRHDSIEIVWLITGNRKSFRAYREVAEKEKVYA